jgi:hypothetical protein
MMKHLLPISVIVLCCLFMISRGANAQINSLQDKLPLKNFPKVPLKTILHGIDGTKFFQDSKHNEELQSTNVYQDTTTFTLSSVLLPGVWAGDAIWVDYDNDEDLDVIVSGWNDTTYITRIYRNDKGVFNDINATIVGIGTEDGVAWGDYDNDGDLDLAIAGRLDTPELQPVSKIYRNDGGIFTDIGADLMPLNGGSVTWIDYDMDGKLDLLICGSPDVGNTFYTKLYHNDDTGFTPVNQYLPGVWGSSIAWADYDGDGDPDLLLTGYGDYGTTTGLFRNDNGVFINTNANLQNVNSGAVAWFDYDNDGDLDIILTGVAPGNIPTSIIYRNEGNDVFVDIHAGLKPVCVSAVAVGDYDNDGDLDIALSGADDFWTGTPRTTKIYRNDNGAFVDIDAAITSVWFGSLKWGDMDKDGRLDLLVTGGTVGRPYYNYAGPYYPVTQIYHNNSPVANVPPTSPRNVVSSINGNQLHLSWDRATDDHTPQSVLTYNVRLGRVPGGFDVIAPFSNTETGYRREPKEGNSFRATSRTIPDLPPGTYYWSVQAVDNAFTGSQFSEEQVVVITAPQATWRIISLPYSYSDTSVSVIFPTAITPAYSFDSDVGYSMNDVMETGRGYWLKFPSQSFPPVQSGGTLSLLTIPVTTGWNLIGSISSPVSVDAITTNPSDIVESNFFGYDGGYVIADEIQPARGYWVKVHQNGNLILDESSISSKHNERTDLLARLNQLIIKEKEGGSQTLYFGIDYDGTMQPVAARYSLPPLPPSGIFDVRFEQDRLVALYSPRETDKILQPISIRTSSNVLTLYWNILQQSAAMYSLVDAATGKEVASNMTGIGSTVIERTRIGKLHLVMHSSGKPEVPIDFALEQNYPNPFNPTTVIEYALPEETFVSLKVFDVVGQELFTLVAERQTAGYHTVVFDASSLPSGVYLCRMNVASALFVRKMLLLK